MGLDRELHVVYFGLLSTDGDIVDLVNLYSPEVIAIDAPLSLPFGLSSLDEGGLRQASVGKKGRECERQLARLGIPCYFTTEKSIIKKMVYRGIELKNVLSAAGFEVIEVYPYASKIRLFGGGIPRKNCSAGLAFLRGQLREILPGLRPHLAVLDHNLCDAAVAAYTACLYCRQEAEAIGNDSEGLIYLPLCLAAQPGAKLTVM